MKKTLLVFLLLAIAGSGAFAQDATAPGFEIIGRVDGLWVPLQMQTREFTYTEGGQERTSSETWITTGFGRNDQNQGIRTGLRMRGATENFGFDAEFWVRFGNSGGDNIAAAHNFLIGDHLHGWFRPFGDQTLTIRAGAYVEDSLRGRVGDNWMHVHTVRAFGNDEIFSRFRGNGFYSDAPSRTGVLFTSRIDNLIIGLNFPSIPVFQGGWGDAAVFANPAGAMTVGNWGARAENGTNPGGVNDFARVFARTQFALGYQIPDIGLIRAQYVGSTPSFNPAAYLNASTDSPEVVINAARIEAAFQLTMVPGLNLDLGFKLPLTISQDSIKGWVSPQEVLPTNDDWGWIAPDDSNWNARAPLGFSVGAVYNMSPIMLNARVDSRFAGKLDWVEPNAEMNLPLLLNFQLWPTYDLGDGLILGLHAAVAYFGKTTWATAPDNAYSDVVGEVQDGWAGLEGGVRFGAGLWLQKNLGNLGRGGSMIRGGLAYSHGATVNDRQEARTFTIPINFEFIF